MSKPRSITALANDEGFRAWVQAEVNKEYVKKILAHIDAYSEIAMNQAMVRGDTDYAKGGYAVCQDIKQDIIQVMSDTETDRG